jgi:hypothetical protein
MISPRIFFLCVLYASVVNPSLAESRRFDRLMARRLGGGVPGGDPMARLASRLAVPLVLLLVACRVPAAPPTPMQPATVAPAREGEVVIVSNTQAHLDGVGVGAGNFWDGEYALPDGARRNGPSAGLWIGGGNAVRVGPGSVVTVGSGRWEVVAIERTSDGRGEVRLRRASP